MWKVSMATRRRRRNQTNCGITWCWKTTIASALTSTTLSAGTILDRWLGQISILKDQTKFHITQISVSYLFKVRIRPVGQVSNWKAGLWWGHQGSVFWQRGGLCLQGDPNYWCTFLRWYARWTNAGADPGYRGGQSAATWQGRGHPSCQPWNQVEPHFWRSFFSVRFMFPYYLMWRKMTDVEIERQYGRYRNKHITSDYALHLEVKLFDN